GGRRGLGRRHQGLILLEAVQAPGQLGVAVVERANLILQARQLGPQRGIGGTGGGGNQRRSRKKAANDSTLRSKTVRKQRPIIRVSKLTDNVRQMPASDAAIAAV